MSAPGFTDLAQRLEERFANGVEVPWAEDELDALALEAFRVQFEAIPAYRAFCEKRGRTPESVSGWREIPSVPATAFKHLDLCVAEPEVVFRTSGTTRGTALRGRHLVPRASLYRASLLPTFGRHLLAGAERLRFVSLIPPSRALPDSSLSFMVETAAAELATETHWLVDGQGALDEDGLRSVMARAAEAQEPVLVLGTALSLLHATERLGRGPAPSLPEGSRVMETGGFKGLDREVGRDELYDRIEATTGVPSSRIVSEYGMTELLSQLYTPVLSGGTDAAGTHVPPPWLRVRALDPVTLEEMPQGEPGILAFFDLANAGSVCHVLTEDVGAVGAGGVRLQGRVRGAEPRGCSRAMDDLMSSAGSAR